MSDTQPNLIDELRALHPADLADRLQRLPVEEARDALGQLPPALAAGALGEIDRERIPDLLAALPVSALTPLLAELPPNDVADLVPALDPVHRRRALDGLSADHRKRVFSLLHYAPDTAGGMMSDRFVTLRADETVHQSQERLRDQPERRPEDISYLYCTDSLDRLVGVVPLRDLVFRAPDRRIADIMVQEVKSVRADTDQEEVARQFEHYHYLGLPVVDAAGRLVGVVKASDALEVAQAEATEDMQLMVGLSGEERTLTPWTRSLRMRLPWLFVNLGTAFLAAAVVGLFESTIAKWTALAIFLPIIAGQGGNAGMQTLTVIIRDLALGEISGRDGWRAVAKEMTLGLINGLAVGLVVGLVGYLWKGSVILGLVATIAMVLNQLSAALAGVAIPFGLKALRVDPALASSIFVTTITDVAGFFFFLGLAMLAMRWMPVG